MIETGGPAFPSGRVFDSHGIESVQPDEGMTLRDYFAAKAMAALSRDFRNATGISDNIRNIATLNAKLAYLVADAMLAERGK